MEQLTSTTKSFIYDQLKELEIIIQKSESFISDYPEHTLCQWYDIKIASLEVQIEFLKSKLFS